MASNTSPETVFCRDCGEEISERAEICPHCGIRQKEPEFETPPQQLKQKDPGLAAVASLLIPGLGQVYNGQIAKGIILGIVTLALVVSIVGVIIGAPLWIWLIYDAYKTAQKTNRTSPRTVKDANQFQKVQSVLKWYKKSGPDAGLTKDTIRRTNYIASLSELSPNDQKRIMDAINAYEDEFGSDRVLREVKSSLES